MDSRLTAMLMHFFLGASAGGHSASLIVNFICKDKVGLTDSKYTILNHLTKKIIVYHFFPIDFHGLPPPPLLLQIEGR